MHPAPSCPRKLPSLLYTFQGHLEALRCALLDYPGALVLISHPSRCVLNHLSGAAFPDAASRQRCPCPKQLSRINNSDSWASTSDASVQQVVFGDPGCIKFHKW